MMIRENTQAMEQGHEDPEDPYRPCLSVQQKEGAHVRVVFGNRGLCAKAQRQIKRKAAD